MLKTAVRLWLCAIVFLTVNAYGQTDPTPHRRLTAKEKLIPNHVKLELVYKEALVTEYNQYGRVRSYNVSQPYVRVNDAKPVEIGKHAEFLRSFFSRCNDADEQIDLMNQEMRKAKGFFWGGTGAGVGLAFTGLGLSVGSSSNSKTNLGVFAGFFAAGVGAIVTGMVLAHSHANKADEHLRLSVDIYNTRCYKPLPADTAHPAVVQTPAKTEAPATPSPRKIYNDTALFNLLRNDPSHSGLFGITLSPANICASSLNLNASAGLGIFYTYQSKFGINLSYQRAYLDDLAGSSRDNPPSGDVDSYGIPASYSKSSMFEIQTKTSIFSWEKEGDYNLKLGNTRIGGLHAEVYGHTRGIVTHAITLRLGYQFDNRLVEDNANGGIFYTTSTPVYTYHYAGQEYPLTPTNISTSSTMIKSGVITGGLGYSTFRDMKIELLDDTYTGRRLIESQSDFFIDALYAQSLTVEDMLYYYALMGYSGESIHLPQRLDLSPTPVTKVGFRFGLQQTTMYKPHFGLKVALEAGMRPGPKTVSSQDPFYLQLTWGLIFGGRSGNTQE
jgi:hypothetical protein